MKLCIFKHCICNFDGYATRKKLKATYKKFFAEEIVLVLCGGRVNTDVGVIRA